MTSGPSALMAALVVLVLAGAIATFEWGAVPRVAARRALQGVMLVTLAASTWLVFQVLQPEIVGHGSLRPGMSMHVDARTRPLTLLATTDLPEAGADGSVAWNYTLDFEENGTLVSRREVLLEEPSEAQGPQLPRHPEERVPVPVGRELDVKLETVSDADAGALSVRVVPPPPSQLAIGGIGLGLLLAGAGADELARRRSRHALIIGYLAVFASMLAGGITPGMGAGRVASAAMAALPLGLLAGVLARYVAGVVAGRARPTDAQAPKELPQRPTRGRTAA